VEFVILGAVLALFVIAAVVAFVKAPARRELPPSGESPTVEVPPSAQPAARPDAPATETAGTATAAPAAVIDLDRPPPSAGRLVRLRSRLARSQSTFGRSLLTLLARDTIDEDTWEEVEDTLLTADVGVAATQQIVDALRTQVKVLGARSPDQVRTMLRDQLLVAVGADADRTLRTAPHAASPAVLLIVGVNGTGKTTTCGKLARALVGDGRSVLLGAADTFRAAAADQLVTWGTRVGAEVVRGEEEADPASIAFEAVKSGVEQKVDTVLIDTAGRLHTKQGLMDELGKVKRVVERQTQVDEVLLVLDATTGQNGLIQARVFSEVVDVTGIVLTKLDGTAKGGIVIAVQRELGVPVKLIGLGEGPDDLAPFEPEAFVDALLGDPMEVTQ
jgi:fused signal recognition particle receptor